MRKRQRGEAEMAMGGVATRCTLATVALLCALGAGAARGDGPFLLDEACEATVLTRVVPVSPNGTFAIPNVPMPAGPFRVRVVCRRPEGTTFGQGPFVTGTPNSSTDVGPIESAEFEPIPQSLVVTSSLATLTAADPTTQLTVTGILVDDSEIDLTDSTTGTFYASSNPAVVSVDPDGLATGLASGRVLVSVTNEGAFATVALEVVFSDDSDGDGIPDDYEDANSVDPGGRNLARTSGATATASSFSVSPGFAIDGDPLTSWFTNFGDAANQGDSPFIEVMLPSPRAISQVGVRGNRAIPDGRDIFAGRFVAFDSGGATLFDSGVQPLSAPVRDLRVPAAVAGVRRLRFVLTSDESQTPGLSELQLFAAAGGVGLDAGDDTDAALDFDGDGLTNLAEYALGTSIFLADSDGDDLEDGEEAAFGTSPLVADSDGDGLVDGEERSPGVDTDGDGKKNALDPDSDNDGVLDGTELRLGMNPLSTDSDFDGIPDGGEDSDGDGLVNLEELAEGTDPTDADSDDDGLSDGEELLPGADGQTSDPRDADSDDDGMGDAYESTFGLDPNDPADAAPDSDGDGLTNSEEADADSDPFDPDREAPVVSSVVPADAATSVVRNSAVVVRFGEAMRAATLTTSTVLLECAATPIAATVVASEDGTSATLRPAAALAASTTCDFTVMNVRDRAGNPLAAPFHSTFTTGIGSETVRPKPLDIAPDGIRAPLNSVILVRFDEPVDPATVNDATFKLRNQTLNVYVTARRFVDAAGTTALLVPTSSLALGTSHAVELSDAIRDIAGNRLTSIFGHSFSTGFAPDSDAPAVLGVSPFAGSVAAARNTVIDILFDAPVHPLTVRDQTVHVDAGGSPVAATLTLRDGNRIIRIAPAAALAASTLHTITVDGVADLAGNVLASPFSSTFTTTSASDTTRPTLVSSNPPSDAVGVVADVVVSAVFSEAMNPLSFAGTQFELHDDRTGLLIPASVSLDASALRADLVPSAPLEVSTPYRLDITGGSGGVLDVAGNTLTNGSFFIRFRTGLAEDDGEAPSVVSVSPPDGSPAVAVNATVRVQMSEAVAPTSVNADSVRLSGPGGVVAATLAIEDAGRRIVVDPTSNLAISSSYTLSLDGVEDRAGNAMGAVPAPEPLPRSANGAPDFSSSFTTAASATSDITRPTVLTTSPVGNATGVSLTPTVTVTFSEPVDRSSVTAEAIVVEKNGVDGRLPATVTLDAAATVATVLLTAPLAPQSIYRIVVASGLVRDLVGNTIGFQSFQFTTGSGGADAAAPSVVAVTPVDDSVAVPLGSDVVVTFSEPLDPSTISSSNLRLYVGGVSLSTSITRATDNSRITIDPSADLPASTRIDVALSPGLRDLAGNALAPFASSFDTGPAYDGTRPSVVTVRPANGATAVPRDNAVTLFFSEDVAPASLPGSLFVAADGVAVPGTFRDEAGQALFEVADPMPSQTATFRPAAAMTGGALGEVFVTTDLTDLAGFHPSSDFHSTFRIAADPATAVPTVLAFHPTCCTAVPRNTDLTMRFSEPMNASSLVEPNVTVSSFPLGPIAGSLSLDASGTLLRFASNALLPASATVVMTLTTAVSDMQGTSMAFGRSFTLVTGAGTDDDPPGVSSVSPPDGTSGLGVNALVRLRFDEALDPLSIDAATISLTPDAKDSLPLGFSISTDNRLVVATPTVPLAASAAHTLLVSGLRDIAGNVLPAFQATFTAASGPDVTKPQVTLLSPKTVAVPTGAIVTATFSEPVDPSSIRADTFSLQNSVTGEAVSASRSLSTDGRTAFLVPDEALAVGAGHLARVSTGVEDLAGNTLASSTTSSFTTVFLPDVDAPAVVLVDPADADSGVPTNARISVVFDEGVDPASIDPQTFRLRAGDADVAGAFSFADGGRRIVFTPSALLSAATVHDLVLAGIADTSGNAMAAPLSTSFTTGAGGDFTRPTVLRTNPSASATGVPRTLSPSFEFSEPLNPVSITDAGFQVTSSFSSRVLPSTVTLDAGRRIVTIHLAEKLEPNSDYVARAFGSSGISDTAGNTLSATATVSFTTGALAVDDAAPQIDAVSPPDGKTGVPVNAVVQLLASERLSPVSVASSSVVLKRGSDVVASTVSLQDGDRRIVIDPIAALATSTAYTVVVDGVEDVAGNAIGDDAMLEADGTSEFTSSFTTSDSSVADTVRPAVMTFSPSNGATNVPVGQAVTLTFTEPISAATVNAATVLLELANSSAPLSTTRALNAAGTVVTLTPMVPLPAATQIRARALSPLSDIAGNSATSASAVFTTAAAAADATPPSVVDVMPGDGATDVPVSQSVVLVFSESIDPNTLGVDSVVLYADGAEVSRNLFRADDNRVVILDPVALLPAASTITVLVTSAVTDLSGNAAADFASQFDTDAGQDAGAPTIKAVRPAAGATSVAVDASAVLFFSEPVDGATTAESILLAAGGDLVETSIEASSAGQVQEVIPAATLPADTLVEVFATSDLLDEAGNPLGATFRSTFRTVVDTTLTAAEPVSVFPFCCTAQPRNARLAVRFSEPVAAASINVANFFVLDITSGLTIAGTRALDSTGRVLTFTAAAPFEAGHTLTLTILPTITDLEGEPLEFGTASTIVIGSDLDLAAPAVLGLSPATGATGVGTNATLRVRFGDAVSPLTVDATTIVLRDAMTSAIVPCTIALAGDNRSLTAEPHGALADSSTYTLTVDGVRDVAGNAVAETSSTFETAPGPDFTAPTVIVSNPTGTGVAINAIASVLFSEPVDPGSVVAGAVLLRRSNPTADIETTLSVSADGRRVFLAPASPLTNSTDHRVVVNSAVRDLAGNGATSFQSAVFTTGAGSDVAAPTVEATSPADGDVGVPVNVLAVVQMDESIDTTGLGAATVSLQKSGAGFVATSISSEDGGRRILVRSLEPLEPATAYTLTVQELRDASGNVMAAPASVDFTTGPGGDFVSPGPPLLSPANGATGVSRTPTLTATWNEPLAVASIDESNFSFFSLSPTTVVDFDITSVSPDRRTVTLVPTSMLVAGTVHRLTTLGGAAAVRDAAGNQIGSSTLSQFTTGP